MIRWGLFVALTACATTPPPVPDVPLVTGTGGAGADVAPTKPAEEFPAGARVEVEWQGTWYEAEVLSVDAEGWKIHYVGYEDSWNETVDRSRIRTFQGTSPQNLAE